MRFIPIKGSVQHYAWGVKGSEAAVAKYIGSAGMDIDDEKTYAELWLSTHPNGESSCVKSGKKLSEEIGSPVKIIFKVLSVAKALSIQAHPDEERAQKLHQNDPAHYPDPYDKPEMAISLGHFKALSGFMPLETIQSIVRSVHPWANALPESLRKKILDASYTDVKSKQLPQAIFKELVTFIFTMDSDKLSSLLSDLHDLAKDADMPWKTAFMLTYNDFPGDVGSLFTLLLNYLELNDGDAIFLAANEPHAYLRGNCIEIMNSSDNVVRAGLTPKFKDVPTLVDMLTYKSYAAADLLVPCQFGYYAPDGTHKFAIHMQNVLKGTTSNLPTLPSHGFFFVTAGNGHVFSQGESFELAPGFSGFFDSRDSLAVTSTDSDLTIYRSFIPNNHKE